MISKRGHYDYYWIGLNQLEQGKYEWADGVPFFFTHWAANEPNDGYGAERCVNMISKDGTWRDDFCTDEKHYICKKLNDTTVPKIPVPTPVIPGYCPQGFIR